MQKEKSVNFLSNIGEKHTKRALTITAKENLGVKQTIQMKTENLKKAGEFATKNVLMIITLVKKRGFIG